MRTPERLAALHKARKTLRARDQKITRMKRQLDMMRSMKGVEVDQDVSEEMEQVIKDRSSEMEALPVTDFRQLFWDQKVRAQVLNVLMHALTVFFLMTI